MQLYALDLSKKKCYVLAALRAQDYFCLECGGRVRVRQGDKMRPHFFHIQDHESCRQAGKTEAHIDIQELIQSQIGKDKCVQELKFTSINRIADVAWVEKKIVFEVQCSPILAEEVAARNRDYESCGWDVVWVLYDKTFNQKTLKPAEKELLKRTHYFSDANDIYDQCHAIKGYRRLSFFAKKALMLANIEPVVFDKAVKLPKLLEARFYSWSYYVQDDWLYTALKNPHSARSLQLYRPNAGDYFRRMKLFFKSVWNIVLERCCD